MKAGKTFMIVERTDEDLIDPQTGEYLGKLEIPKGRIEIIYVADKYSVAESRENRPITSAKVGDLAVEQ